MKLYTVITNNGDGSNSIKWVKDEQVLARMEQKADDGDETYASGDGLQVRDLIFPEVFDLDAWINTNRIRIFTMDDFWD